MLPDMPDLADALSKVGLGWLTQHPWVLALVVATVLAVGVSARNRGRQQDPVRAFPEKMRREAFARAGGTCEYARWWGRCRRTANHADHFYPHARGGASTLANCVAACQWHNLSKGAKLPSRWTRAGIERRRRRYFPPGADVGAGQWF